SVRCARTAIPARPRRWTGPCGTAVPRSSRTVPARPATSGMPRHPRAPVCAPGILVGVVEAAKLPEERWQQLLLIAARGDTDPARDEARGVLQQPHVSAHRFRN